MSYGAVIARKDCFGDVPRSSRLATVLGYVVLVATLFIFAFWSYAAPIAGAVVAQGVFVATGQNKVVQHLEGGVIREILVREGDVVRPGQLLVELDKTAPEAELRRLMLRYGRATAIEARLQGEIKDESELAFPQTVLDLAAGDDDLRSVLNVQKLTFESRRVSANSEIAILQEGINALRERIGGSNTQLKAVNEQLGLIGEELEGKEQLLKGGMIKKPEVLALQRARANLRGETGRLLGDIGDSKDRIARAEEQILGVKKAAVKAAVEQLNEIRAEVNDVRERMRSAKNTLDRIRITAPVHGSVVKLRYHTPGGVIEAGKPVLEIVPLESELIIEVQVRPQDIDYVKAGQDATIRLTALSQRNTPMISGRVLYVSADALPVEKRGTQPADAYIARVKMDAAATASAVKGFKATAGMPAEVYITTSERSFLEYLMRPLENSFSRAFREP
jgi:HlyD family secretion protein